MPDRRKAIKFDFPFQGINENRSFRDQPKSTTPDALNVRPYDPYDKRLRGGQRSGLSKYFADAINGSNSIQAIRQIVLALDPSAVVADTLLLNETFQYDDGILHELNSAWTDYTSPDASAEIVRID